MRSGKKIGGGLLAFFGVVGNYGGKALDVIGLGGLSDDLNKWTQWLGDYGAVAAIIAGLLLVAWSFYEEKAPDNANEIPDWKIIDLFNYLLSKNASDVEIQNIAQDIRDKAATGQLIIWGRELPEEGSLEELFPDTSSLYQIPEKYWVKGDFTYRFFSEEGELIPHTNPEYGAGYYRYSDLHLSKERAKKLWPISRKIIMRLTNS